MGMDYHHTDRTAVSKMMRNLTETWLEAKSFFREFIDLHDATLENVTVAEDRDIWLLHLSEISRFSDETGFSTAFDQIVVELSGVIGPPVAVVADHYGFDIIDARLSENSFWMLTLKGELSFNFRTIRFALPEKKD